MLDICAMARVGPPRTKTLTTTLVADSGINDRLIKLRSLIDRTCFEFIDVTIFVAISDRTLWMLHSAK